MTYKRRSERGFTVIELLAVISIMMVVTAIATPSFYYWLPKYRLSAGARQIAADLQLARMKAISQNTSYRLRFTDDETYQIWKEDGVWAQAPNTGDFELPDGITVSDPTVFFFDTSEFQSRGTANTGVGNSEIEITNTDGATQAVCMETVGRVHIENSAADC